MRLRKANLIRRESDDGLVEMREHAPIGKEYIVDIDQVQEITCFNTERGLHHNKVVILTYENGKPSGLMFACLLDIDFDSRPEG